MSAETTEHFLSAADDTVKELSKENELIAQSYATSDLTEDNVQNNAIEAESEDEIQAEDLPSSPTIVQAVYEDEIRSRHTSTSSSAAHEEPLQEEEQESAYEPIVENKKAQSRIESEPIDENQHSNGDQVKVCSMFWLPLTPIL